MRSSIARRLFTAAFCLVSIPSLAQTSSSTDIQQLKDDIKQLQTRVNALEPQKPETNGPEAVSQAEAKGTDTMDAGMGGMTIEIPHMPEMKFRGFGDVRAFVANQNFAVIENNPGAPTPATQGGDSTFALGLMDLFVTSQITEHFSYLTEIGFEADPSSNGIGVDLERAQLSYTPNQKFSISVGRTHAMRQRRQPQPCPTRKPNVSCSARRQSGPTALRLLSL
jgi:hypothetical protein